MRYLSVCSGIEAASVAWHHLGWKPVAFSEIEPFPCSVLKHRFPDVPNYGDMTAYEQWPIERGSIDLLVGGTPCQSFSVAGLRQGLADPRGNLMLTYLGIAARLRPKWIVWENVPGVLSSGRGRDFGSFLGALGQLGYGWAYRVLDAQYLRVGNWPKAVPQRRRRVFVVGRLIERGAGDWSAAGKVLAIREGLQRHLAESRTKRQAVAGSPADGTHGGCWWDGGDTAATLTKQNANGAQRMPDKDNFGAILTPAIRALCARDYKGVSSQYFEDGKVIVTPYRKSKRAQSATDDESWVVAEQSNTINGWDVGDRDTHAVAHAFYSTDGSHGINQHPEVSPAVKVGSGLGIPSPPAVARAMTVRRLTPRECERLQGFPDDWTLVPHRGKPAADGPRYKALGNSMACNCMAWIGEQIHSYTNS
jgi:DNA (cytosine-5)-methyltransferase 1